jgi:hypothetical protein
LAKPPCRARGRRGRASGCRPLQRRTKASKGCHELGAASSEGEGRSCGARLGGAARCADERYEWQRGRSVPTGSPTWVKGLGGGSDAIRADGCFVAVRRLALGRGLLVLGVHRRDVRQLDWWGARRARILADLYGGGEGRAGWASRLNWGRCWPRS